MAAANKAGIIQPTKPTSALNLENKEPFPFIALSEFESNPPFINF